MPDTGYHFTGWSDGIASAQRRDTAVTGGFSVTANFEINKYLVTYVASAGGSIDGAAVQSVTHGTSATPVKAMPATGYRFVKWSDGVTTPERQDLGVTSPKSVTAEFEVSLGDPTGITFGPDADDKTTIRWAKAQNAIGYQVYVNGKLIATVGADKTSYTFKGLLGPKARVRIKALGDSGFESELVAGGYKAARSSQAGKIRFSGFSGELTPKAKRELRGIAALVKRQGFTRVEVAGHTSTRLFRGDAYHKRLSLQRAEASKRYLEAEMKRIGVKAKVVAKGYGKSKPIASNLTWWGRFANRRVEVSVR